jgi:hypothetical protein
MKSVRDVVWVAIVAVLAVAAARHLSTKVPALKPLVS